MVPPPSDGSGTARLDHDGAVLPVVGIVVVTIRDAGRSWWVEWLAESDRIDPAEVVALAARRLADEHAEGSR